MSLLSPWYLLGLLGLLLPWLLHRFSHHEPPEQAFPTTRFLEPTTPPATSKRQLRYWLLFALRILFLIALCFLFAQPILRILSNAADAEAVQVVVVDTSFSMRAAERWEEAQNVVNRVINELPEGDAVQLFSHAGQLTAHTDITNDRGAIRDAMSQLNPGFGAADFGELMRRLDKVAGDIDKPVSATFISDAQRSNLPVQMNTLVASRLQTFEVVSVSANEPINYFLQADAITSDTVTARVSVTARASEHAGNDTDSAAVQKRIEVSMNGKLLASQEVLLSAGDSKTIQFDAVNLPSDFDNLMKVSFAQQDFLPEDDQVELPVRGLSAEEVVITSIGGRLNEQARVFVSTAFETDGEARVEVRDANSALAPSVRHAVVFVDDLNDVPDVVQSFVASGGNALVLQREPANTNVLPLSSKVMAVATIDMAHELALGDIDWFNTRFFTVADLQQQRDDQVLLSLDSGQPLLLERRTPDAGRLLLLNDALDGFNSDLPLQASFVQLTQQVLAYFDASNALPVEIEVGKELFLPANTQILTPEGVAILELDQLARVNYVRMDKPGVFTVLGANSDDKVSVVLNAAESNLPGLNRDELDTWQARHDATDTSAASSNESSESPASSTALSSVNSENEISRTLWRWLLPIVLGFVLLESLLANRLLWVRRDGL